MSRRVHLPMATSSPFDSRCSGKSENPTPGGIALGVDSLKTSEVMCMWYQVREVAQASPIFVDAFLSVGERWLFGSFWGNETGMQQFLATLTLADTEVGIRSLTLNPVDPDCGLPPVELSVKGVQGFTKTTGKTGPGTQLGSLVHLWAYDAELTQADRRHGVGYVLSLPDESDAVRQARLWDLVMQLSHVPLLPHWEARLMLWIRQQDDWIQTLEGMGVTGYRLKLPPGQFEEGVSHAIKLGVLSLTPESTVSFDLASGARPQLALL
jgi:hypothetical protein